MPTAPPSDPSACDGEDPTSGTAVLPLRLALEAWCDPSLVKAVKDRERRLTAHDMDQVFNRPALTPRTERRQPTNTSWAAGPTNYTPLTAAWRELETDLRSKIAGEVLFLRGVQAKPERRREAEPIPGAWAADFSFDFMGGAIDVAEYRFTAVTCSRRPFPVQDVVAASDAMPASAPVPMRLRPEDVPDLDDDTILALLEEHARRVATKPDKQLLQPGKISLMPLLRRRMEFRASRGELLPSLASEAVALETWITSKVPSHQVPSAKAIENGLRSDYAALRTRSNPMIP